MEIKRRTAAALMAGPLAGGGAGAVLGLSQVSHAADSASTTTAPAAPATPATPATGGRHVSNEDAAHEAAETPEREAAEDNGTAHMGRGGRGGHSNEDPAHEASESPEREKAEDAAAAGGAETDTPTTAATSSANV